MDRNLTEVSRNYTTIVTCEHSFPNAFGRVTDYNARVWKHNNNIMVFPVRGDRPSAPGASHRLILLRGNRRSQ